MKTLFCMIVLIVYGLIASFLGGFVLNMPGLLVILITRLVDKQSKHHFVRLIAFMLTAIGQSYIHLAFTAFVVSWTLTATRRDDVTGFLVWPLAFLVALFPVHANLRYALSEAAEMGQVNIPTKALHVTYVLALFGFFIFIFIPPIMKMGWSWIPYVSR